MNVYLPNVSYREQGSLIRGDIVSFLLSKRVILCTGEINIEMANIIIAQLIYLTSKDNKTDINIYINSNGGHVESGLAIFDMMNQIEPDIKTICVGTAYSMGAMLLLLGTPGKRFALKHSSIMIHQPLMSFSRDTYMRQTDINIRNQQLTQTREIIAKLINSRTNKSIEQIMIDIEIDKFMTSEEALEYGIIDYISNNNEVVN
jgi:ATP-dependent Clp protease protease subunit